MINFYHKAIENCSVLLKPLYDILKQNRKKTKSTVILWTQEQKDSFQKVKSALSKKSVLSYFIPNAPTFLASDASDSSIAGTLYQLHPTTKIRVPLAFFLKNLQKPQSNYSIFDKEILALYSSIRRFQFMLENRPFTILCDNQAVIKSITKSSSEKFSARVLRQLQFISQYSTTSEAKITQWLTL